MRKKIAAALLTFAVVLTCAPNSMALISDFTDISGHWAEDVIDKWAGYGVLKGDNGLYRPNNYITRCDLAVILCRIMNYQEVSNEEFSDLDRCSDEQRLAVLKLNAAGVMLGSSGRMRPFDNITREEASVIIGRAMYIKESGASTVAFKDVGNISDWALKMVMGMSEKGYLAGRNDGYFYPKANMTRAEVIQAIDNVIITGYFYQKGSYAISYLGNAIINTRDVELRQTAITGDLIITDGAGDGTVTLTDVTVEGTTYILGGAKGIVLNGNTRLGTVMHLRSGTNSFAYKGKHTSLIEDLYIEPGSAPVTFEGYIRNIHMNAPNYTLTLANAMVVNVNVNNYEATLSMDNKSYVSLCTVNETLRMTGKGIIGKASLRAGGDGSSFETQPRSVSIPTATTVFLAGNTYSNSSGVSQTISVPTDTTAPLINDYYLLVSKIEPDSVTLAWKAANDNVTAQSKLRYMLFYSTQRKMNTVEDIEQNGYPAIPYTANKLTGTAGRLKSGTVYYFNVIVIDDEGNKSCYEQLEVELQHDDVEPEVFTKTLTASYVKHNEFVLSWNRANDNLTAQEFLKYSVYQSDSAILNTPLACEQHGKQIVKPTADISSARITGLKENSIYYFNVVVEDEAGNKSCYIQLSFTATRDITPPVVGAGRITTSNQTGTGVTLSWDASSDLGTENSLLKYTLYNSTQDNINTVDDIKKNGKVVMKTSVNQLTYVVSGLKDGVYYFNVLVQDETGNTSCYPAVRLVFGIDKTPPVITNAPITIDTLTKTGVTLSWTVADDLKSTTLGSQPENLQYTVYRGDDAVMALSGSNYKTPQNIKNNSVWNSGAMRNTLSLTIADLEEYGKYYFNVIVTDDAGNESCYEPILVFLDVVPPDLPYDDALKITPSGTSFIIEWLPADDGPLGTKQVNLTYTLYWSETDLLKNFNTLDLKIMSIEYNGHKLTSAKNLTRYTHTGRSANTEYYYYLMVTDEIGNKTMYDSQGNLSSLPVTLN